MNEKEILIRTVRALETEIERLVGECASWKSKFLEATGELEIRRERERKGDENL